MWLRIEKIIKTVTACLSILLYSLFAVLEAIQLSQGIYTLFENPGTGFSLYFFRLLACLVGLTCGSLSIWASLGKRQIFPLLNPIFMGYCFLLSLLICVQGAPLFGLSNDSFLIAFPVVAGIGLVLSLYRLYEEKNKI